MVLPTFSTRYLNHNRSRVSDVLSTLRSIPTDNEAIQFLVKYDPDVSKAVQNFLRTANQGHEMTFRGVRGEKRLKDVEKKWNQDFAPRVYRLAGVGFDGLLDVFHKSAVVRGGMGCEVIPTDDLTDIYEVYPFDPAWLQWELQDNLEWEPYQWRNGEKVYVRTENFIYVPTEPDINDPRGTLMFTPALVAVDSKLQTYADLALVLHKAGYPREDIKVLREPIFNLARSLGKSGADIEQFMKDQIDLIRKEFQKLEPDSTYIHYDDVEYNLTKGANERGGVDVRPYFEALDPQIMNALGQMGVFQNRTTGITETWGTVQYRIFVQIVESLRRGSKRLVEKIARNWLRVNGIQAVPHFEWKVIDWEADKTRKEVQLLTQEFYWLCQKHGWITADEAAMAVVGHEAKGEPTGGDTDDNDNGESQSSFMQRRLFQMQVEQVLRNILAKEYPQLKVR